MESAIYDNSAATHFIMGHLFYPHDIYILYIFFMRENLTDLTNQPRKVKRLKFSIEQRILTNA